MSPSSVCIDMTRAPLPDRATLSAVLGAKILLVGLMVIGAVAPQVGGFAGKGIGYRLPVYMIPVLVVPLRWLCGKSWNAALDIGLTVPFLLDTLGNLFGLFDRWNSFDNVLHFVNWLVLVWGITMALNGRPTRRNDSGLVWVAGTGIGALAAIGWEIAEYRIMRAGVGNLHLTYPDTLGDLAAGSVGGALGAWLAVSLTSRWWFSDISVPIQIS
jgi:hypothetical protein